MSSTFGWPRVCFEPWVDVNELWSYTTSIEKRTQDRPKRAYRMAARADAAAATEERLLASAWEHFSARPYEEVRLADIATDAGVTVQTLHARLGTKEAIFVAAWAQVIAPEGARRLQAPVGDVRRAVRLLYDSYEAQSDAVFRMLAAEERIPAIHEMAESGRAWHRAWVERTFAPLLDDVSGAARERRLVQLVVATDALVWKLLRREMGLGRAAAERIVIEMITALKGAS